ncbi:uncharacterized protein involved in outer membrane biogenesis [Lewinella marina]|uniref:AsmA-like C-terminal domain-containing protein n=1 Tax=Neolewinella marina TaxID=438751 RepID=A0A2G0CK75_9BACT|nr:AsmA-like C-terminal region-containing protein [Neolewinella marina]NJB84428.1 uncharacterized protein involved in outer membrane biogenesis [Neolewinella marina]PHL00380.1 hypothetical protein CGL56_04920 [Neolewinella marina]
MLKILFRGLLVLLGLAILLPVGMLVLLDGYLRSNEEKLVREIAYPAGLDIVFREVDITAWSTFPRVTVSVDSLVVRDTVGTPDAPPLLRLDNLSTEFSLAALFDDTLSLRRLDLRGGALYLVSDSAGRFNAGTLLGEKDQPVPPDEDAAFEAPPQLAWDGVRIGLTDIDVTFRNPPRDKHIELYVDSLRTRAARSDSGTVEIETLLASRVRALAFNTTKGAYLTDAPLSGRITASLAPEAWTFPPTPLRIGDQEFTIGATIARAPGALSRITIANDNADYDRTHALLNDKLREKLAEYHVSGRFPVRASILTTLESGGDPEVTIDFTLKGQQVRVKQYDFADVFTRGTIVNRLDEALGGIPGSKKNMRVDLDSLFATYLGTRISSPQALVAVYGGDARLEAPLQITGPASAVSHWLENRDFFFDRGRFSLTTTVNASLLSFEDMAASSDGRLQFWNLDVVYRPAGVSLPFQAITVTKQEGDIGFRLASRPLPTGFSFRLLGNIDNLTPLLIDQPGARVSTDVTLLSRRIDWTDWLGFFGQGGYFNGEEATAAAEEDTTAEQVRAMKVALSGLQRSFHPRVEARFDTVAYYDVLALTDLATGLRFAGDTLVLERTTFDWAGSNLAFGARLDLSGQRQTPFQIAAQARHLDLNRMRPALTHFGVQVPGGLDSLPDDLSISFNHAGIIEDALGIRPGTNTGEFIFNDGRNDLFAGSLAYSPGPQGLSSHLRLGGDPQIVNVLFGSRDFFFGTGRFSIDLCIDGNPSDLRSILHDGELQLRIDSSRIAYRPAEVYVPVEHFSVDVEGGNASYRMDLLTDSTRRAVELRGELTNLPAFVLPTPGETFRVRADATAANLHWADLRNLVEYENPDTSDQAPFDPQSLLSTTSGIFRAFRPDLSLRIDTFWAGRSTPLLDLHSGLRLSDSTELRLERSGFTLEGGRFAFDATYQLDDRPVSPFSARWSTDTLALEALIQQLKLMEVPLPDDIGVLRGELTMDGSVSGLVDEVDGRILMDSTQGKLRYRLTDAELADWPMLNRIGRKAWMAHRFRHLHFAPLEGEVKVENGRLSLPRTEVQSTGFQVFLEGELHPTEGPDLLVSLPLRNIGRGLLPAPPDTTGYAFAGWKVFLVYTTGRDGEVKTKFRLGRRRYYKNRGRLDELRELRQRWRALRRAE